MAGDKRTVDDFRKDCLRELIEDQDCLAGSELRDREGGAGSSGPRNPLCHPRTFSSWDDSPPVPSLPLDHPLTTWEV